MAEPSETTRLEEIARHLQSHGVHFIVIGGQAETLYGSPRVTVDVDLCYSRAADNLKRLAGALRELHPTLRGAPPDLPFRIDEHSLALGANFTFCTELGDLDLLGYVEPLGGYEEIDRKALTTNLGTVHVRVIDLDDLIRIKQHLKRTKDVDSLAQLLAIKRARDGSAPPGP